MLTPSPERVMREVTIDMVLRALKLAKKKGRAVFISKTANGKGVDISTLDPRTTEGKANLDKFLSSPARHYTFSGLGAPEEPNAINWRQINLSPGRKILVLFQVGISFLMKGIPFKNTWYRWMG